MFFDLRTKEKEIVGRLYKTLELKGFRARILPLEKIKSLHDSSWRNYLNGKIPPRINKLLESIFPVNPSKIFTGARSVLIVSAADGYNEVKFDWVRKSKRLVLPPALETYRETEKDIKQILLKSFGSYGFSFVKAVLPLKLLSSYCTYLRYGSNKVAYIPVKKATVRLFAFYTDFPFERGTPDILKIMEELCLVSALNINSEYHHQTTFSIDETRLLLESTPLNKIPESTRKKIVTTDLIFNYNLLGKQLWKILKVKPADFWKIV